MLNHPQPITEHKTDQAESGYLDIEVAHPQRPPRRLPHHGKRLWTAEASNAPTQSDGDQTKTPEMQQFQHWAGGRAAAG
jgi:hypothetical protein